MPSPSQVHVDVPLSNVAVGLADIGSFIGPKIYLPYPVSKQSGKIFEIDPQGEALRLSDDTRAPGHLPHLVDFQVASDITYFCNDHAQEAMVADEEAENADDAVRGSVINKTWFLMRKIMTKLESDVIAAVDSIDGGLIDGGAASWNVYGVGAGDPIADILAGLKSTADSSGIRPNTFALGHDVASAILNHPDVQSRLTPTISPSGTGESAWESILKQIFNLQNVFIAKDVYANTAAKGAVPTFSQLWGERALLCYVGPNDLMTQNMGIMPVWNSGVIGGAGAEGVMVKRGREDRRGADWLQVHKYYDLVNLKSAAFAAKLCAHLWTNTLT